VYRYTQATAADAGTYGCDVVFMCTGMAPRTDFMKGGELAATLDAKAGPRRVSFLLFARFFFSSSRTKLLTPPCRSIPTYGLPALHPWDSTCAA
jgi:hypothetical protein